MRWRSGSVSLLAKGPAGSAFYTLSLHDALPISVVSMGGLRVTPDVDLASIRPEDVELLVLPGGDLWQRSEEHTSELQSRLHLVCRLLLEKKNKPGCQNFNPAKLRGDPTAFR